jgi:mannonate dehydratase
MRWFGPNDPFGLDGIRQAGCSGVVTALHHIPVGEIWTVEEIEARKNVIEAAGLSWTVIESLPVHEDIKTGSGRWRLYIDNYKTSLANVAACGLKVVTYNFMPVLDWVRTDVSFRLPDGSEALRFERAAFIAFDLFILKRPDAMLDYSPIEIGKATALFDRMSNAERTNLSKTLMLGLPGSDEAFTPALLLSLLDGYKDIDDSALRSNLFDFLREISPVAEELGLHLAIHPDDPPYPVLGLPRIVSTQQDARRLLAAAPDSANGLCFCTGSYGARPDNDLLSMLDEFGERIHFLHLRNTARDAKGNFYEADHLTGDTDMVAVVDAVVSLMARTGRSIPMRPDHGHRMLDDLHRSSYPGYSGIGRMKSLAELRGLELALSRQNRPVSAR